MFQWPPANVGEGFSQNGIDELAKIRQMSLPSLSWNYTSVAYIIMAFYAFKLTHPYPGKLQ